MDPARIAELLQPFFGPAAASTASEERSDEGPAVLSPTQLQHISIYIDLLLRWNARINLTAVRDAEEIVTRHFGESFFAARCLFPVSPASSATSAVKDFSVADLGSGAGFPGLPIKLWAPNVSLTLIESNHKKAAFLREVVRILTLTNVSVRTGRAESLPGVSFDVVTLRAVERFQATLPIAANLVAPEGRLALLIGSTQFDHAQSALPDLAWAEPELVPLSHSRVLAIAHRPETVGSLSAGEPKMS